MEKQKLRIVIYEPQNCMKISGLNQIGHLYADTLFVSALPGEPAVLYTQINGCRAYVAE